MPREMENEGARYSGKVLLPVHPDCCRQLIPLSASQTVLPEEGYCGPERVCGTATLVLTHLLSGREEMGIS